MSESTNSGSSGGLANIRIIGTTTLMLYIADVEMENVTMNLTVRL